MKKERSLSELAMDLFSIGEEVEVGQDRHQRFCVTHHKDFAMAAGPATAAPQVKAVYLDSPGMVLFISPLASAAQEKALLSAKPDDVRVVKLPFELPYADWYEDDGYNYLLRLFVCAQKMLDEIGTPDTYIMASKDVRQRYISRVEQVRDFASIFRPRLRADIVHALATKLLEKLRDEAAIEKAKNRKIEVEDMERYKSEHWLDVRTFEKARADLCKEGPVKKLIEEIAGQIYFLAYPVPFETIYTKTDFTMAYLYPIRYTFLRQMELEVWLGVSRQCDEWAKEETGVLKDTALAYGYPSADVYGRPCATAAYNPTSRRFGFRHAERYFEYKHEELQRNIDFYKEGMREGLYEAGGHQIRKVTDKHIYIACATFDRNYIDRILIPRYDGKTIEEIDRAEKEVLEKQFTAYVKGWSRFLSEERDFILSCEPFMKAWKALFIEDVHSLPGEDPDEPSDDLARFISSHFKKGYYEE